MALVRQRRQLSLCLPLPEPLPDHRPRFFPLPSSSAAVTSGAVASFTDLEKLEVLGHGNGGTVYKVRHKRTASIYALKVAHAGNDPLLRRHAFREMEILRRTDSPYIVRCHGVSDDSAGSGNIAILMEHMDAGSLAEILKSAGTFSEQALARIAAQVLNGLVYLHSQKIIHRDLKPSNLLVNQKMEVKIADFGVSKIMCRTLDPCNSYVGTCAYMSPERFDPETYGSVYDGYAADIWSLGLTLMELYMGHFPFLDPGQRPDWATLMCAICFGDPPMLPETASEEFRGFMECCMQKESTKRWSAAQLLTHPFVAAVAADGGGGGFGET